MGDHEGEMQREPRAFKNRVRHLVIASVPILVAILTTVVFALPTRWLLSRNYCADSKAFCGLVLLTLVFLGSAFIWAWIPKRRTSSGRRALVPACIIAIALWLPLITHWPPISRASQKGTMADMRILANAIEQIKKRQGGYPTLRDVAALNSQFGLVLPLRDRWGQQFVLVSSPVGYTLVSYGDCGRPDVADARSYEPGATTAFSADIVFRNGRFVRYPEGVQVP